MIKSLIYLFSFMALFISCTPKQETSHVVHDELILTQSKLEDRSSQTSNESKENLNSSEYQCHLEAEMQKDSNYVFSESFLKCLSYTNTQALIDKDLLLKYDQLLMNGCTKDLTGCLNMKYLANDPGTTEVIVKLAKKQENIWDYYQRLFLAFEVKRAKLSITLQDAYMQRSRELIDFLTKNPALGKKFLPIHQNIISLLVTSNDTKNELNHITHTLNKLTSWDYSQSDKSNSGTDEIFEKFVKSNLFINKKLNPQLVEFLKKNSENSNSLESHINFLKKYNRNVLATLDLNIVSIQDEFLFLVDRLFLNHITLNQAELIFNTSQNQSLNKKLVTERIVKLIKTYLQIEFLYTLTTTHIQLKNAFLSDEFVTANIIEDAFTQAHYIAEKWNIFYNQSDRISNLVNLLSNSEQMTNEQKNELYFLKNLKTEVKKTAVYPDMLFIAYQMGKRNFSMEIPTMYGKVSITASDIILKYFLGEFDPWFDFGNDKVALNKLQVIESFQLAVQNGFFDIFEINPNDFFQVLAEQYFGPFETQISKNLELIESKLFNTDYSKFTKVCTSIKSSSKTHIRYSFENLKHSILLGEGIKSLVNSGANFDKVITADKTYVSTDFNPFGESFISQFEKYRLFIKPKIENFELLQFIVNDFYKPINSKFIIDKIQKVESLKLNISTLIKKYYQLSNYVEYCYFDLLQKEYLMRSEVISNEIKYLKLAYKLMAQLRNKEVTEAEANKLLKDFNTNKLNAERFNYLNSNQLIYHPFDFLVRTAEFLNDLNENISYEINIPANYKKLDIYNKDKPQSISYQDSEEEFVLNGIKNVIRSYQGMVFWHAKFNVGLSTMRTMILLKAILYKLGPIKIENQIYETTKESIYKNILSIIKTYSIQNQDIELYKKLGIDQIHDDLSTTYFWIHPTQNTVMPYFDAITKAMTNEFIDSSFFMDYAIDGNKLTKYETLLERFKEFNYYMDDRNNHIIAPKTNLSDVFKAKLSTDISDDLNKTSEFINFVKSKYEIDSKENSVPEFLFSFSQRKQMNYLSVETLNSFTSKVLYYKNQGKELSIKLNP